MNITNFLPNLKRAEGAEETEAPKPPAPKHGPSRPRYLSNGQLRRAHARHQKAQTRKATKRYRNRWMESKRRQAVLFGQLQVVGMIPFRTPDLEVSPDSALHRNAEKALINDFGDLDTALETWRELQAR